MAEVNVILKPFQIIAGQVPNASTYIEANASENPITWGFDTQAIGSNGFARAVIVITGLSVAAGETLTINGKVYNSSLDPDIEEFLASPTPSVVANSIKQMLEDDPTFGYKYRITIISNLVYLNAVKPGTKYNLSLSTSAAGIFITGVVAGTNSKRSQSLSNYSVWVEIWANLTGNVFGLQSAANARLVRRLDQPANPEDRYIFDISSVAGNLVSSELPSMATVGHTIQSGAVAAYLIRYGEQYSNTGNKSIIRYQIGEMPASFVCNMALPLLDEPKIDKWSYQPTGAIYYLNGNPADKLSRRDSLEWLYILYVPQTTAVRYLSVWYQVTFVDGSQSAKLFSKTMLAHSGNIYWRVDYQSLSLGTLVSTNGKEVLKWSIEIVEHNSPVPTAPNNTTSKLLSQKATFKLSENCEPYPIRLVWLNALGGWDTFTFDGFRDIAADISKVTFEKSRPIEFPNGNRRSEKVTAVTGSETFVVQTFRSELINDAHHQWLLGLFASSNVYYVDNGEMKYVSEISGKWERMGEDALNLVEGKFKLTIAENVTEK